MFIKTKQSVSGNNCKNISNNIDGNVDLSYDERVIIDNDYH